MTGTETAVTYVIDSGWICEQVNEHTCGTGRGGYFGAHEPGCGLVPVVRVEDALKATVLQARVLALFAGGPDTPCRTTWPEGVECVEVPMADLRVALGDQS